jgi:hypothetical protein
VFFLKIDRIILICCFSFEIIKIGATVKRKRLGCSNFQNILGQGLFDILHHKINKKRHDVGVAAKAPSMLNLA